MRKRWLALVGLLLVLSLASNTAAASTPFLAPFGNRTLLINLIGVDGSPIKNAEVHLLTPGVADMKIARTDHRGQATLQMPDGFSFWIRVWADGYALIERPYVPASDGPVLTLRATPYTTVLTGLITDDQGLPVPQAQVSLFRDGYGLEFNGISNEMGVYTFSGVQAGGTYSLQVEAKGYQPVTQSLSALSPNSRNQVDLPLTPAAGAVTGEVVDAKSNRPVSGVVVELLLNGWGVVEKTRTDSLGYFHLSAPSAPEGLYQVRLSKPNFETSTSAGFTVSSGSWTDFSGGSRFTMNQLYARMSGKVTDQNNSALSGIEVHLQRQGLGTVDVTTTDEDGKFKFEQITGGTYRMRAFPEGNLVHSDTGWLAVAGGETRTANIVAQTPDTTYYGAESLTGTVRDHMGEPVAGAQVLVHRGQESYQAVTDEEGRYDVSVHATVSDDLDDDPATGYHVMVSASGFLANDQPDSDGELPPSLITIQEDSDNQANFTLQPETATIAGRVVTNQGRILPGLTVGLLQEGQHVIARTTTDASGRYHFPDLPFAKQGRYTPVVLDSSYIEGSVAPDGTQILPASLSPTVATSLNLVARPATNIVHGLVQAGTDKPAAEAMVTVTRPADGKTFTEKVNADGSYQVRVPAAPGDQYLVRTTARGAVMNADPTVANIGDAYAIRSNLTVHPSGSIAGRVFGPDGKPVSGMKVLLYGEGSATPAKITWTDDLGMYRFADLTPSRRYAAVTSDGVSRLSALSPGELIITPLISLPSGETHWVDLSVSAPPFSVSP